jgi:hypothetical protein
MVLFATATAVAQIPPVGPDFRPAFQKGICLQHNHSLDVGYGSEPARVSLARIRALGADSVSISPLGYMFHLEDPRVFGYQGENPTLAPDRIRQMIRDAHNAGLRVFLNPHIWIGMYGSPGDWRGDVAMRSEEDWLAWFRSYREFILFFARMAQEEGVALFSVGSEMRAATMERPWDWRLLIREIRGVYSGPCTYAANWFDEFDRIPFWDELEYIGISAYFPIGGGDLAARLAEARKTRDMLATFAQGWGKPVLFCELGFRSVADAGREPGAWKADTIESPDFEEQRISFETIFETFWNEGWFFGLYVWMWFTDPNYSPLIEVDYQIRNKPAEKVVEQFFQRPAPR